MVLYDYYEPKERVCLHMRLCSIILIIIIIKVEMAYGARSKRDIQSVCSECWSNLVGQAGNDASTGAFNGVTHPYLNTVLATFVFIVICLFRAQ
jgi:hypothetical protein